jgi:hypothetical protein
MHPMDRSRSKWSAFVGAMACLGSSIAVAQPPALGPTSAAVQPAAAAWPTRPPTTIYVLPFAMEPGLQEQLQQQASVLPQGPVRKLIADRPRVTDLVTGHDRSVPAGVAIAKLVADELAAAGWPVTYWDRPEWPPADGWRLTGQVVSLGSAAAQNMIGFGVGNASIGIDVALADPATAGGQPFFILDSSDKGRRMPGTLPIAAVAGFNPAVVAGKLVASNSGLADIAQQQRMADEIARSVAEGVRSRWPR